MIQCRDAFRDMRTARWLTFAPRCQHSGRTFHLGPVHMKGDKHDATLPSNTNGYLYGEKNRPRPICLPFQHHEHPTRIEEFDPDDDWDITDIDGIKNETPMVVIQHYNGFFQGIRNNRLGIIAEEEETVDADKGERQKDNRESLYSRHSLDSTTDYASDDDDHTEYDGQANRFQGQKVSKHGISTSEHFQRKICTTFRPRQRFAKSAYEKWSQGYPVHIRNVDNFLLHQPVSSVRATHESVKNELNVESEEYFQTLSEESETWISDKFLSKRTIEFQKNFQPVPSMTNCSSFGARLRSLQDHLDDVYKEGIKSLNQTQKSTDVHPGISKDNKDTPLKYLPNNLTGNDKAVNMKERNVTSGLDLTDDDFYKTFLPSSLADNESVTKINPIAILYANQNEEESHNQNELDDKGNSSERTETEFVYSVEDFPHPPDYFFDLDSFSLSSVSLVTDNYKQDVRKTNASCVGQLRTEGRHICQSGGQLTFVLTNQNNEESVDSSSECFSEFAHQSSRESDFISESVSTEFTFEENPSEQQFNRVIRASSLNQIPDDKSNDLTDDSPSRLNPDILNNEDIKTRHDAEDTESMGSKQTSDTTLRSYLSMEKTTCRSITSRMKCPEDKMQSQCETNSQTDLPLNKSNFSNAISTKNSNHALQKKNRGIKTHGRYLHHESDHKSEYTESNSVLCENTTSASMICLDHFQEEDQSTKARLSAVQNMLQRAITIDNVCFTTGTSCQWKSSQCSERIRVGQT